MPEITRIKWVPRKASALGPPDPWISNSNLLPSGLQAVLWVLELWRGKEKGTVAGKAKGSPRKIASGKMSCTPHSLPRPEDNPPWGWARGAV